MVSSDHSGEVNSYINSYVKIKGKHWSSSLNLSSANAAVVSDKGLAGGYVKGTLGWLGYTRSLMVVMKVS